jgi:cytochrome c-type biogenesis protein CcmH/NrfG
MLVPFLAGLLTGATALFVATWLWRRVGAAPKRLYAFTAAAIAAFAVAALLLHLAINWRRSGEVHVTQAAPASEAASAPAASAPPQSMDSEVAKLEARLARNGGSDADWTLLAQAYDFLGRPDDARRARAKIASPAVAQMDAATLSGIASQLNDSHAAAAPGAAPPIGELEQRTKSNPRDAGSWLALADARRGQRDFPGALAAYQKVIALKAMTAQSWADYADALASSNGGSLSGGAGAAIDQALALDANNSKALWLKASQAHENGRFADALVWWKKLRALLPAESSDARIIDGNIAEDTALLAGTRPSTQVAATAPAAGTSAAASTSAVAELSGTVSLDTHLAGRVPADATLFIYAKAADAPGPPLAVMRTRVGSWPVAFHLDDSMAMIASRKLSQFNKVVVEARISRTGTAMPSSGDLYATSDVLNPTAGKKLALVINHEIG